MHDRQQIRFLMVEADLDANAWLETELLDRFERHQSDINSYAEREIRQMLVKRGQHFDPLSLGRRVQERLNDYQGILCGRLPRPVFRQLYLLAYQAIEDRDLQRICAKVNYAYEPVNFHYRRNEHSGGNFVDREFPQSFIRDYLVYQMKGDISKGSANKLIVLMSLLRLVSRVPAVTGGSSLAIRFDGKFKTLIDQWLDRRSKPSSADTSHRCRDRNPPDTDKDKENEKGENESSGDETEPYETKRATGGTLYLTITPDSISEV